MDSCFPRSTQDRKQANLGKAEDPGSTRAAVAAATEEESDSLRKRKGSEAGSENVAGGKGSSFTEAEVEELIAEAKAAAEAEEGRRRDTGLGVSHEEKEGRGLINESESSQKFHQLLHDTVIR
eukprot:s105_g45.t1